MPTLNVKKTRKQAVRSLAYRLRGKDPVAFRRGRLFEGEPKPIRRWFRRQKRTIPIRVRMAINERIWKQPTPWMWNPTLRREPKMVRVVRKNIENEAAKKYLLDSSFLLSQSVYTKLLNELHVVSARVSRMSNEYIKNGMLDMDTLPLKWRKLHIRLEILDGKIDQIITNAMSIYLGVRENIARARAIEWTLNRMGYPVSQQYLIVQKLFSFANRAGREEVGNAQFQECVRAAFKNAKQAKLFLKYYPEVRQQLQLKERPESIVIDLLENNA